MLAPMAFRISSISYGAVRKTQVSIKALVDEGDQGGENGMQSHGEDDGRMDCAFDEAKGERPSAGDINCCIGRTPDGRITVEVYGDCFSQTVSWVSCGDVSTLRLRCCWAC